MTRDITTFVVYDILHSRRSPQYHQATLHTLGVFSFAGIFNMDVLSYIVNNACPKIVEIEILGMPFVVELGTVEIFEKWCIGLARRVRVILG